MSRYRITGTLSFSGLPNAEGLYFQFGSFNGYPVYMQEGGAWYLYMSSYSGNLNWTISPSLFDSPGNGWQRTDTGTDPAGGVYDRLGSTSGDPAVALDAGDAPDPDDLRKDVVCNGVTGNLIVPAAADLRFGVHAGWHHAGTPGTWEVTGSDTDRATGTLICFSNAGVAASGISITIQQKAAPEDDDTGHGYSTVPRTLVSGDGGAVQFTNLFRNTQYLAWQGNGTPIEFTTPDEASFELPTILGDNSIYNVQTLGSL